MHRVLSLHLTQVMPKSIIWQVPKMLLLGVYRQCQQRTSMSMPRSSGTLKQPMRASFQRGYVLVPGLALQSRSRAKAGWSLMTSEICNGMLLLSMVH